MRIGWLLFAICLTVLACSSTSERVTGDPTKRGCSCSWDKNNECSLDEDNCGLNYFAHCGNEAGNCGCVCVGEH
jgi:hypothetical protein